MHDVDVHIKFSVMSTPILLEPHVFIAVDVTVLEGGGSGLTSFGDGTPIFVSIFTNDREIDTRLSTLETRTVNIDSFATQTNFGGNINMDYKPDY